MNAAWPRVSLGELIRLERRPVKVDVNSEYQEIGIYCFGRGIFHKLPRTGLEVGEKNLFQVRNGDLILQVTFAWEGAIAVCSAAEDGLYGSTRYPTFRVDENRCDPRFLAKYLCTREGLDQINKICPGSAGRNRVLAIKRLPEVKIPLPPLNEQRRIVATIYRLTGMVEEAKGLSTQTNRLRAALYSSSITRVLSRLTADGMLGEVLVEKPRNGWSAKCDNAEGGVSVLSLSAVTGFVYNENAIKRTSETTDPKAHYWLQPNDLLITRSNTPALVGHAAIYNGRPSPCIYPDLMMKIPLNTTRADTRFVWRWLQTSTVRDFVLSKAKGTSPTMKKISQGVVLAIPFPVHVPLARQRELLSCLDSFDRMTAELQRHQESASVGFDAMIPSILDEAFRSEL